MSYSINIKGKENPKDKQFVKLEIIFFKTGYARVPKILPVTGLFKDWDNETQSFKPRSSDAQIRNKQLADLKMKYLKVVEEWEESGEAWSPVQWSHSLDDYKVGKRVEPKIIPVRKWMEEYIETCRNTQKVKNNNIITCTKNANLLEYLKRELDKFTVEKYSKSFSTYFFQDITEQFIKDYVSYIEIMGLKNGNKGGVCTKLRRFRGVCSNATRMGVPGASIAPFKVVEPKLKWGDVTPKTIPYEVFQKIENIDRDFFNEEEQFYLDLYLFSFYAGGMGDKDVCYFTWNCIVDDTIIYERIKYSKIAKMPLTDKARKILNKYKGKGFGNFVFPVFTEKHVTEKQKDLRVLYTIYKVNRVLERVRGMVMYNDKITWYSARGTFITHMIDMGIPVTVVAETAGNSPATIFKNYWKNTQKEEMRHKLNSFM